MTYKIRTRYGFACCALIIALVGTRTHADTIVRSARFGETVWAVTDFLPGGANAPFVGVPDPAFNGADVVEYMESDINIPALNQPVTIQTRQIQLNERNLSPLVADLDMDGDPEEYNFYFVIDPNVETIARLTIVQTSPDDGGPGPEGVYMQESVLNFLTRLVPLDEQGNEIIEQTIEAPGSIPLITPVPIPFSFDPFPETPLVEGLVGDFTANWHINKTADQKDFFSLGGLTQMPHGGRSLLDVNGVVALRGGASSAAQAIQFNLSDAFNGNEVPDYYEGTLTSDGNAAPGARGTKLVYDRLSGEIGVSVPNGVELTAIDISSASGIFSEDDAENLNDSLTIDPTSTQLVDRDTDFNIFKATFGTSFSNLSFGNVATMGLSKEFILSDVSARVLFADGESYGLLGLHYVPEPNSVTLACAAIPALFWRCGRKLTNRNKKAVGSEFLVPDPFRESS